MTHVRPFLEEVVLDAVAASLRARGQRVIRLDASGWTADDDLYRELGAALDLPAGFRHDLDGLSGCLAEVTAPNGLAVAFVGYDNFSAARPDTARAALEIIDDWCVAAAARGQHVSCLVQPPIS
ncbi:barstar family protein [Catenuloplanes indicus]|uniref:RNAse (Barnase) inhibitor barstar n=1 Tax=Catenuloplanes indicus TaxID=137267 RepID=A0AAE3W7C4_9ACTN|nr:barstar family protein [Catenuloplanes indicus]MDQ0370632.1 RNAse (barnase) inhibitor barstar [Catenuloplanes indicus]